MTNDELKSKILELSKEYSIRMHKAQRPGTDPERAPYLEGETIPYAGRVFDEEEVVAAVDATLDFWLTLGKEGEAMQAELAQFLGVKYSLLVNSGSSANLVALSALTSHKLPPNKRIMPRDEILTVAAGFPTTVAPIVQVKAVPVFIDASIHTGNALCEMLEDGYVEGKTKGVMMAHALGNPFELITVLEFCQKYDLWLVEDNCDALGCTYSIPLHKAYALGLDHLIKLAQKEGRNEPYPKIENEILTAYTGTFGDVSTQSFYPPHHLTMGEGGAVNIVKRASLKSVAESFRDWGRDCWCPSGKDNTCCKRFDWQLGELPHGYDHKYIYSHLGFNVKPLDTQAAIGRVQMKRLPDFIQARKENWQHLRAGLDVISDYVHFALPTHALSWNKDGSFLWDDSGCRTDCSWFGFKITLKEDAPFTRTDLCRHLDEHKIGNRMLFGGNMVRQPAFVQLRRDDPNSMRVIGDLDGSDYIMRNTLFLGTYPGLTKSMVDRMVHVIVTFVNSQV